MVHVVHRQIRFPITDTDLFHIIHTMRGLSHVLQTLLQSNPSLLPGPSELTKFNVFSEDLPSDPDNCI
jgi:hypothetical protein